MPPLPLVPAFDDAPRAAPRGCRGARAAASRGPLRPPSPPRLPRVRLKASIGVSGRVIDLVTVEGGLRITINRGVSHGGWRRMGRVPSSTAKERRFPNGAFTVIEVGAEDV